MKKDQKAVAAVLDQATAAATLETVRGRLEKLTGQDFPALSCLLDLLAENPAVVGDNPLAGAVGALNGLFVRLWDDCEAVGV